MHMTDLLVRVVHTPITSSAAFSALEDTLEAAIADFLAETTIFVDVTRMKQNSSQYNFRN